MKKVLSIVLVLAIFIVPVGTVSCLADRISTDTAAFNFNNLTKKEKIKMITMEVGTDPNGEVVFSAVLTGERGRREKVFKMPKGLRARFSEPLDVVNKLRNWKRGSAWVLFNFTDGPFAYIYAEFYDEEARLVKSKRGRCFSTKNDISFDNAREKLAKAGKRLMNSKEDMFFSAEDIGLMGAFKHLAGDAYCLFT